MARGLGDAGAPIDAKARAAYRERLRALGEEQAAVATGIFTSERNRPAALGGQAAGADRVRRGFQDAIRGGMAPADVAGHVLGAIRGERFYVLTHPDLAGMAKQRADDIAAGRSPTQGMG